MRNELQKLLEQRVKAFVSPPDDRSLMDSKDDRKKQSCYKRSAEIVKTLARGKIIEKTKEDDYESALYNVHFQFLIKQKGRLYIEEEVEIRKGKFYKGELVEDDEVLPEVPIAAMNEDLVLAGYGSSERLSYNYDRRKAVQYAERWWNSYNPAFKKFEVDCTNFISQCLYAGGAPMKGYPNRGQGWWLRNNNWSYSWSVANSLRWYLSSSKSGLRSREVKSADLLIPGDVICYDFQGDGRFDHNTIVTGKDGNGMPLVNAHTYNSRMRYWAYLDSSAYTPKIKYKFYSIIDDY